MVVTFLAGRRFLMCRMEAVELIRDGRRRDNPALSAHPDGTLTPGSSSHYSGLERVEPRRRRVDVAGPCGSGHRRARLVNTSSDNPAGRAVGSSLAVFAQPTK